MIKSNQAGTESYPLNWVSIDKCCELIGWTKDQVNSLRTKGKIRQEIHWIKREGRIYISIPAIQRWIETGI
jgi:hypothetical protein